jgi:transporter family-2 protein
MQFLYGLTIIAGILNTVAVGCNATLAKSLQIPFAAALAILTVSFASVLVAGAVSGQLALPGGDKIGQVPWWGWLGGALGAVFMMAQLLVADRVGAAVFMGVTVTAAVIASIVLDHFGWLGFQQHPAGPLRLLGAALMVVGVGLVAKF